MKLVTEKKTHLNLKSRGFQKKSVCNVTPVADLQLSRPEAKISLESHTHFYEKIVRYLIENICETIK